MTTSAQMKRLEVLEAAARARHIEATFKRDLQEHWPSVKSIAADLDISVEALLDEARKGMLRAVEIGNAAYEAEIAAEMGMTVEVFRRHIETGEFDRQWEEYKAMDRERRARVVHYRAGVAYNGAGERV
jgi:hypothetical protein